MTSTQARKLTLGTPVFIVGLTYELKKDQRKGEVVGLTDRTCDPLVTVKTPNGSLHPLDCHWIQTQETFTDLFDRYWYFGVITPLERDLVKILLKDIFNEW